ncbi:MAG: hypothetical protein J5750_01660 [Clostridiales bacterium]|nr:hypothetical protein [Clostridiales bacterium]
MAKNCPGCGAPMEYDPGFDSLVCSACGNIIDPKTLPDADDFYHNDENDEDSPIRMEDTLSEFDELTSEMYDCHIYICSQCGGEVIVSGTEISTRCVYCGATAVVFSRIAKANRPDSIVPFAVTKEEAIENVSKRLLSGAFVPKAYKSISPECVRGIYIPYFTYEGTITDTQRHTLGLLERSYVFDGSAEFSDLLVESCQALNDRMTALLEPYSLRDAVDFDSSYLMGFYSNVQDITPRKARGIADLKARTLFQGKMKQQSPRSFLKQIHSAPQLKLKRTGYVLLPAWFITLEANGTPYTFLVNGQTGKVVGTAPWNKTMIFAAMIGSSLAACALLFTLYATVISCWISGLSEETAMDIINGTGSIGNLPQLLMSILSCLSLALFIYSVHRMKRLFDKLNRTGSVVTFIFSKKRQGGAK